ncbi:hypothetical protein HZA87_05415 [Candidatus Uhrbacteria bacterium]|nr:hypothetical protein [Candidatus Uhrbacteria bacterium]
MTPLQTFLDIATLLARRPFVFLETSEQKKIISEAQSAVAKVKKTLVKDQLEQTQAFAQIASLESASNAQPFDEANFLQALRRLMAFYHQAEADEKTHELIVHVGSAVSEAESAISEHHMYLDQLARNGKEMSAEQKEASDKKTMQEIGVFYVLEYTLQVLFEFSHRSDDEKWALLKQGLQTPAGNLPGLLPLERTFRKELCYAIFDEGLRTSLLMAFFLFEDALATQKLPEIGTGLKRFNLELLEVFRAKGLEKYHGMIYVPFGNDLPIADLIKKTPEFNNEVEHLG